MTVRGSGVTSGAQVRALGEIIQPDPSGGFVIQRILPAGDLHTHANELLASDKMRQLMAELSEFYHDRVIVFDSPPLLLTTEASVLASFMGQIVFVVSADQTPQHAVTQAIEYIGEDKMVGMVLNRARRRSNPYYYAYGELYGYGRNRQSVVEPG